MTGLRHICLAALLVAPALHAAIASRDGTAAASIASINGTAIASVASIGGTTFGGGGGFTPDIGSDNFDPTGYQRTWVEEAVGATVDEDHTGTGTRAGQSLRIVATGTADRTYTAFTADADVWAKFYVYRVSNSGTTTIAYFSSGGSPRGSVQFNGTGQLRIAHGATANNTSDALATGAAAVVWTRYVQGSGANGVMELAWADFVDGTSETRPTSGNKYVLVTTGTATSTVDRWYFGSNTTATHETIYDDLLLDGNEYPP